MEQAKELAANLKQQLTDNEVTREQWDEMTAKVQQLQSEWKQLTGDINKLLDNGGQTT